LRLGPIYNRLTWRWALPFTKMGQSAVDRWRQHTLGLAPISWSDELRVLRSLPHLFGFSPSVLPKPRDWAEWVHVTGYWFLGGSAPYIPSPELDEFLRSGDRPVAIGFSSQVGRGAAQVTEVMVGALQRAGKRGILVTGWGGLKGVQLPDGIMAIPQAPYDWLLPRVSAMVHHGGAGSTACALLAGVPNFAVPFGFEQGLWGTRIAQLGAGVAPLYPQKLTVARVASAIRRVSEDESFRLRASRLAEQIRQEDGIGNAVRLVTRMVEAKRAN
jgi:UDP:flavonoid glycosyltransferase YjiC (YdhE family)